MQPFSYSRVAQTDQAVIAGARADTLFLAGGTELLNWMRLGIVAPAAIVDISRIEGLDRVEPLPNGGIRIGALVKLNDAAQHPTVMREYPVLSEAMLKAASAQLRNLATVGGNLMQRTRCPYFRAEEVLPCNKRVAGSGCAALHGINDKHAIFGWTDGCVAVQPSDPAVALAALDAVVVTEAQDGGRRIPVREFHTLPETGDDPSRHNVLRHGELITAIEIEEPAPHSAYLKIRERESYEYATVSAAAAVEMDGDVIQRARIALGSVAHRPWRLEEAETRLAGTCTDSAEARAAIDAAFVTARPLSDNGYKIPLARNAALRVLETAAAKARQA
jgi:xanthine dehydrogenase YagS FAD-binding subunit